MIENRRLTINVKRRAVLVGEGLEVDALAMQGTVLVVERVHVSLGKRKGRKIGRHSPRSSAAIAFAHSRFGLAIMVVSPLS